jgi:hypothetical protein
MDRMLMRLGVVVAVIALLWVDATSTKAQATTPDAIDPIYALSLTEAINNRNPDLVLEHFVAGGTVTFDNSGFSVPNETITAAEYAARYRPNDPDIPADVRLEIVDGSLQISATGATWTWRQTASFLRDLDIDYLEFTVVAETRDHRFKSLTVAPTPETLVKLPYSPSSPAPPQHTSVPTQVAVGMPPTGGLGNPITFIVLALVSTGLVLTGLSVRARRLS